LAKFETVPIGELKHRLSAKLLPLVEEYREKLEKLTAEQGGRLTLEKGDDPKELRRALKAAAGSLNGRIRSPFRGEDGSLSFYLEGKRGRRGRRPKGEAGAPKKRGRPRKASAYSSEVAGPQTEGLHSRRGRTALQAHALRHQGSARPAGGLVGARKRLTRGRPGSALRRRSRSAATTSCSGRPPGSHRSRPTARLRGPGSSSPP
jgi:hypothetical protein